MGKLLFLSAIVFAAIMQFNKLHAQKLKNFSYSQSRFDSTRLYYKAVYKAEDFLISGATDSALYSYMDARNYCPFQVKERFNLMFLWRNAESDKTRYDYFLFNFPYTHDTLKAEKYVEIISSYISEELAKELLMSLKNVEKIADPDPVDYINLSAELEPMDELDQQYRPNTEGEKGLKKQRKNDKQNFKTIAKCYKKYGPFYGSKLRGEAWPALRIVLVHRFADKSKRDRSHDFFVNEVKAGHIDARSYADIYDNYIYDSTQVYGMHTLFFCRDTLFVFNLNEDYKKQLNKNRSEIFLEDIDAFHEKMIWQWQNETKFRFGLIWEIMPYGDQKAEEIANEYLNKMGSCASSYSVYTKN